MRNVTRIQEPPSFQNRAPQWRQDLREKIQAGGKISDYYYDRYNQKAKAIRRDLEDALLRMYSEMCCYCEAKTPRTQGEIEHLRPKKKFPDMTYDWNNLHWVCCACNGIKLEQYDDADPVLDPSDAELIANHIVPTTDQDRREIWFRTVNNSRRGQTTIAHIQLNRDDLKTARLKVFWTTVALIEQFRRPFVDAQTVELTQAKLKTLYEGEFGFVTTVQAAFQMAALSYEDL